MKKLLFAFVIIAGFIQSGYSQKVDSIKVEQAGDFIKVHYKILNSNNQQVYRVTVLCSINGGLMAELKSLSGDFGDNVAGGRSDYMVLWDVLKDVDEVRTVDFSVRAELLKDDSHKEKVRRESGRKVHVLFTMDSQAVIFGVKAGYLDKWGGVAGFLSGTLNTVTEKTSTVGSEVIQAGTEVGVPFSYYNFGVSKRIVNKTKFQMHGFGEIAFGKREGDRYQNVFNDYPKMFIGADLGLLMDFGRLSLSIEMTELPGLNDSKFPDFLVFGLGMRF